MSDARWRVCVPHGEYKGGDILTEKQVSNEQVEKGWVQPYEGKPKPKSKKAKSDD